MTRPSLWMETPDGGVRPASLDELASLYATPDARRVALDSDGIHDVSTVFLAHDHAFTDDPNVAPVLYETMVFPAGGSNGLHCRRYHTRAEAVIGHAEVCREWLNRENKP